MVEAVVEEEHIQIRNTINLFFNPFLSGGGNFCRSWRKGFGTAESEHRQRSTAFCTQALMFSALASRLIDALVAINYKSPAKGPAILEQEWAQSDKGGCELTACWLQPGN